MVLEFDEQQQERDNPAAEYTLPSIIHDEPAPAYILHHNRSSDDGGVIKSDFPVP